MATLLFNCTNFMLLSYLTSYCSKICFNVIAPPTPAFRIFSAPVRNPTRLMAGRTGVRIPAGGEFFISKKKCRSSIRPTSFHFNGYGDHSPQKEWSERDADHTPPCSAEVETMWSYTSTPPPRLHGI